MNATEYITRFNITPDYIDAEGNVYNEDNLKESYDEMLDESGPVVIAGLEYAVSDALQSVDPTAYRCGMSDHQSALGWDDWTHDHEWNISDEDE